MGRSQVGGVLGEGVAHLPLALAHLAYRRQVRLGGGGGLAGLMDDVDALGEVLLLPLRLRVKVLLDPAELRDVRRVPEVDPSPVW